MTLLLTIPASLEHRLREEASRRGQSVADYTIEILQNHAPGDDRSAEAVALLQSWIDRGNESEQKETGALLIQSLNEDRPSERKLFPPELEGVTW
jgi:hypothetical protein